MLSEIRDKHPGSAVLGVVRISEIWEERGSIAAEASSQPSRGLRLQGGLSSFVDFVVGTFLAFNPRAPTRPEGHSNRVDG